MAKRIKSVFRITEDDKPLILRLSAEHQQVLNRSDMTAEGMAAELGIPVGTAKSRLHRARLALIALRPAPAAQ